MFDLTKREEAFFGRFNTPQRMQGFLDDLPINHEKRGDTCYGPRLVLRHKKAHCFEGALLGAALLWYHGKKPLLMNLRTIPNDDDHAVVLFRQNGLWGALSKTNHAVLRYRDPIYKTPRELAASYFHEYFFNDTGLKTLRAYSKPFDLSRLGKEWVTSENPVWKIAEALRDCPHTSLFPEKNKKYIRHASILERKAGRLVEWSMRDKRT